MSDSYVTFVRLDPLTPDEAVGIADSVINLLRRNGIVIANDQDSEPPWGPGPNWSSVTTDADSGWLTLSNKGVDVSTERKAHNPMANYEPPGCGRCGTALDPDVHMAAIGEWFEGAEPVLTCPVCGWSAPVGDWPGQWLIAIGAPALTFNNWPPLREEFASSLRQLLAGRTVVVYGHV
jgi:hypothetical protein